MICPEDIDAWAWEKAYELWYGRHERGFVMTPLVAGPQPGVESIARALMAERERCAQVAESYAQIRCKDPDLLWFYDTIDKAAAAIRKGETR
jgi:hypothetical protein